MLTNDVTKLFLLKIKPSPPLHCLAPPRPPPGPPPVLPEDEEGVCDRRPVWPPYLRQAVAATQHRFVHCDLWGSGNVPEVLSLFVLVGTPLWEAGSYLVVARRRMLYIIGLGLGDEKDITLRGLEAVKKCDKVYVEAYTSLLSFGISSDGLSRLEKLYGKSIIVADREMVEERADIFLSEALESDVAFLVFDEIRHTLVMLLVDLSPHFFVSFNKFQRLVRFKATTHTDLVVRAKKLGVKIQVIHNASVMNAIGICGLQLYRFGETVSIPFFTETWRPDSFYEKIHRNRQLGLHTLCLLDIQVKEPSLEHLCRGKKSYLPPRFMTINTAIEQLLEVEQRRGEEVYTEESKCIGVARLGYDDQKIVAGSMKELLDVDFGPPLHCLVIVGTTHHVEEEMLEKNSKIQNLWKMKYYVREIAKKIKANVFSVKHVQQNINA
ncbi:hypothetical protein Taro_023611 [Colocasia esculenta]|uniref:diphthine methyl ester synthase n=1 Tax=Colocasia esculenta TaxID=4460 RepID=A0A843V556_COLES|nr:hypothetical protein [Colocasia esculenta]